MKKSLKTSIIRRTGLVGFSICWSIFLSSIISSFTEAQVPEGKKVEDAPLNLQILQDFYSAEQLTVQKPIVAVEIKYRASLEKYQKDAQAAGDLKSVLAAKNAIDDLGAGRPAIGSDDKGVAKIQISYLAQRKLAEAETVKALQKIDQDYLGSLKNLVSSLTKAGRIEQAMEAQTAVDLLEVRIKPDDKPDSAKSAARQADLEIWIKKSKEEFPELSDPNSNFNLRFLALKKLKGSIPGYFDNPQWPYLLAQEVSREPQKSTVDTSKAFARKSIPKEAKQFNGKWYYLYYDRCSWNSARNKCETRGGQLVVIPDESTETFVKTLVAGTAKQFWLGAKEEKKADKTEGVWIWSDGSELKFRNFRKGEPNNSVKDEDFLVIDSHGDWWDTIETSQMASGYICEWQDK